MALYTQTFRIHGEKPLPLPTGTRKNQTQLMLLAKWLDQALGGLAKVQGYDCIVNASGGSRASQTVTFGTLTPFDAVGIITSYDGARAFTDLGASPSGVAAAAAFSSAVANSTTRGIQYVLEASSFRGGFAFLAETAGLRFQVGQWEFTATRSAPTEYGQFQVGSTDAVDAANFARAINVHPQCSRYFGARANLIADGNVHIWVFGSPPGGYRLSTTDEKMTPNQPDYVNTALVRTQERSALGNAMGITALGTNVTVGGAYFDGATDLNAAQTTGVA